MGEVLFVYMFLFFSRRVTPTSIDFYVYRKGVSRNRIKAVLMPLLSRSIAGIGRTKYTTFQSKNGIWSSFSCLADTPLVDTKAGTCCCTDRPLPPDRPTTPRLKAKPTNSYVLQVLPPSPPSFLLLPRDGGIAQHPGFELRVW